MNSIPFLYGVRKFISRLTLGLVTVFNCFLWTGTDTRHAVSTVIPPHRLSTGKADIAERADSFALTAGYTAVSRIKRLRLNGNRIKQFVHGSAVDNINRSNLCVRKHSAVFYTFRYGCKSVSGFLDNSFCLSFRRRIKHNNIVIRHYNFLAAAIFQLFITAYFFNIPSVQLPAYST